MSAADLIVAGFNATHPIGTPVRYWPGGRFGAGRDSTTRSSAWLVSGIPCVSVEGFAGGVALTHVEVLVDEPSGASDA